MSYNEEKLAQQTLKYILTQFWIERIKPFIKKAALFVWSKVLPTCLLFSGAISILIGYCIGISGLPEDVKLNSIQLISLGCLWQMIIGVAVFCAANRNSNWNFGFIIGHRH